jgi:hypothetical protein
MKSNIRTDMRLVSEAARNNADVMSFIFPDCFLVSGIYFPLIG